MIVLIKIIALFMCIILPISNFIGSFFEKKTEFTYSGFEPRAKEERELTPFEAKEHDIFVSPSGSDEADGSEASPLKTIGAAKALAAKKRADGVSEHINVWVGGGRYRFDSPLEFGPSDAQDVSYIAREGDNAVFDGSVLLTGWESDSINGIDCLSAAVPEGISFSTVIGGGVTLPQTRYPESGYFFIKETDHSGALFTDENSPWKDWSYGDLEIAPDDSQKIREFKNPGDVSLRLLHYWCGEISYIGGYDGARNRMKLTVPLSMKAEKGQKYYYENVAEVCDRPGEWYFDRAEGRIFYIPREGENAGNLELCAAVTDRLIKIDGCDGITFEGIEFANTNSAYPEPEKGNWLTEYGMRFPQAEYDCGGSVEITNSEGIAINYCSFKNIGIAGVKFNRLVKNSRVVGCDFKNTGAGAVFIHGYNSDKDPEITENITVKDNLIDGYGRYFYSACGVLLTHARNCEISNNEIRNGYYTAISVGWLWGYNYSVTGGIKIKDNLICDIGQGWLSDMGGIYTLGNQPGTVISGNVIRNVAADTHEGGYGGWGIYLDEGSQNIVAEKNLVFDCGSQGFHQHYGENNLIRNNIFALNREGQLRSSFAHGDRQTGYADERTHNEFSLESNITLSDDTAIFSLIENHDFTDKNNIYYDLKNGKNAFSDTNEGNKPLNRVYSGGMKLLGLGNGAVYEDPGFKDPENFDFTLPDNSEALAKIGFEKWDYSAAGTLTDHG